jgi:type II secretory pathway pseudopilin PulG
VKRHAFSLLEIIIATAVLAASAMVLSSLIGLGSRFGNRAEERTLAMSQAESLLDEYLAGLGSGDNRLEASTGELPGPPPRGYRISAAPWELSNGNANSLSAMQGGSDANAGRGGLLQVTVMLFEASGANLAGEGKVLIELSRLIRQPQPKVDPLSSGIQSGAAQDFDPAMRGGLP